MRIVITGASGHVGNNLVRLALERGERVRAMVHADTRALKDLQNHPRLEQVPGDVMDPASLRAAFDGADGVVHCAARISISGDPRGEVRRINVDGARHAAAAARDVGVARYVHVSSVHAYDHRAGQPLDEASPPCGPNHPAYDRSKAAGEAAVREVTADGSMALCVVQPSGVLGPWDFGPSRMGRLWGRLANRSLPALVPGGFDWVDARDVGHGILAALQRGRHHESYLMAGRWASMRELAEMASQITGVRPPRVTVPFGLARLGAPFVMAVGAVGRREPLYTAEALGALQHGSRDIRSDKARQELGFEARPLMDTVEDAHRWLAEHAGLPLAGG